MTNEEAIAWLKGLKANEILSATKEALDVAINALEERPRGEWIDHSDDYGYAECPFCEHLTNCDGNIDELHYCWNCGAKLGKGGAE